MIVRESAARREGAQPDPPGRDDLIRVPSALERSLGTPTSLLAGIFLLLLFYTLYYARTLLLPIALALLASLALRPLVRTLRRAGLPNAVGAAVVLFGFLLAAGWAVVALSGPAVEWIERAPSSVNEIEAKLRFVKQPLAEVTAATQSLEEVATVDSSPPPEVRVVRPSLAELLFTQTQAVLAAMAVTLVLLYFLLAAGDEFIQGTLEALPWIRSKERVGDFVRDTETEISKYLLTIGLVNASLGAVVACGLWLADMPTPLLWGALAAVLNFVPYLGALSMAVVLAGVAILTFDELGRAITIPLAFLVVTGLEGWIVTPLLLGRRLLLSPVMVFLGLLVWTWLWGIPGTLIAVPTLVVAKIVCDRVTRLRPLAQVLGR